MKDNLEIVFECSKHGVLKVKDILFIEYSDGEFSYCVHCLNAWFTNVIGSLKITEVENAGRNSGSDKTGHAVDNKQPKKVSGSDNKDGKSVPRKASGNISKVSNDSTSNGNDN